MSRPLVALFGAAALTLAASCLPPTPIQLPERFHVSFIREQVSFDFYANPNHQSGLQTIRGILGQKFGFKPYIATTISDGIVLEWGSSKVQLLPDSIFFETNGLFHGVAPLNSTDYETIRAILK